MFRRGLFLVACAASSAVASLSPARADVMLTGVAVAAFSSELGSYSRQAVHTVDGSGVNSATATATTNGPGGTMWETSGDGSFGGGVDLHPYITYDLGALYVLSSMVVYNYNESIQQQRGVASADVSYGGSLASTLSYDFGHRAFAEGTGSGGAPATTVSLSGVIARYVMLSDFAQFAGASQHYLFGLNEVQFYGVAAPAGSVAGGPSDAGSSSVPEPALGFVVGGVALVLGLVRSLRRSPRSVAVAA